MVNHYCPVNYLIKNLIPNFDKIALPQVTESKKETGVAHHIWIALCMYLLLAFVKFQSKLRKSMQQILRLLQFNLFEKRDLMALLRGDPPRDKDRNFNQMMLV